MGKEKGAAADGAEKKEKEPKMPKAKSKQSYDGETTDAAMVSASRLAHMCSLLSLDDILGYIYQIALHIITMVLAFFFAWIWFKDLEAQQDPFERASVNFMIETLDFSEMQGLALSNITTAANFSKANATAAQYTLGHCGNILNNFFWLHILFLGVFMGMVVERLFKLAHRIYVIVLLPVDPFKKWEGYESFDTEGEHDDFTYTMRNWNGDHNKTDHMRLAVKIFTIPFIILPDVLFTLVAMYTGVKLLSVSSGTPYKLAKGALKATFLLKFPKLYYTYFTSHNMKIYLVGGEYWIPQTKAEAKADKLLKQKEQEGEDEDPEPEKPGGWDMWYSWGSFIVTVVLGFGLSFLWVYFKESPKNELVGACDLYRMSPAAQAYENNNFTTPEFPEASQVFTSANIMQKIFYVPRS